MLEQNTLEALNARAVADAQALERLLDNVSRLVNDARNTDGVHHKRFYIQQIASVVLSNEVATREQGIAP